MENKKLIQIASILLVVFAVISMIVAVVNVSKSLSSMTNLTPEEAAMVDLQMSSVGMDLNSATVMVSVIAFVSLAIVCAFSIIKIVVGALALKNPNRSRKFFRTWGTVFLIFGIIGLRGGVFHLLGVCNLLTGIVAPALFLVCAGKMGKEAVSMQ